MYKYLFKSMNKQTLIPNLFKFNVKFLSTKKEPKLSLIDKIKLKFSIKPEEKIDYTKLQSRNEDSDNHMASKLENEADLEDEANANITKMNKSTDLDIEKIDSDIEFALNKFKVKEELKGSPLEILKNIYKINTETFSKDTVSLYENADFKEVIEPRLSELKKLGFSDFNIKIIIQKSNVFLLNPKNIEKMTSLKELLMKLLPEFSESEVIETLSCIPNITEVSATKIESNIKNVKEFFPNLNHKDLLFEYPLLISNFTSDLTKFEFYFKLYLEMSREDISTLATTFPLLMTATPDNVVNLFKTVDRMKFDRKEWREIIQRNPKVFLFRHTQLTNVVSQLTKYGLKAKEVFEIIKVYPDLLLANRYSMLKKKLELFEQLKMNKDTIKNLIKEYPFILLKSYNSFINKVFYFNKEIKIEIEDLDIYPMIYCYSLKNDIKPRCELMKKANKSIPYSEAFSMTLDQLAEKLGVDKKDIAGAEDKGLFERDLMFRYSKYITI